MGEKKPFTPDQLSLMKSVGQPALSPDGQWVAYRISETLFAKNKRLSHLWLVPSKGGKSRQLTRGAKSCTSPVWTPDGKSLAFQSGREKGNQIYLLPMVGGGEARKLTNFPGGIDEFVFTPDGKGIVFAARTYLDCGAKLACIRRKDAAKKADKVTAMVHEHLMYRHWDTYEDGKVQHLFHMPLTDGKKPATPRDLTPKLEWDALCFWLMSAGREFDISPDSKWVVFSGTQEKDQAVSYNHEIFRVAIAGGKVEKLTENPASDMLPRFSPDGDKIAYRASRRAGYESDRYEVTVLDLQTREVTSLTPDLDRSVSRLYWAPDGDRVFFEAEDKGDVNLYAVDSEGGDVEGILNGEKTGRGYHLATQIDSKERFFVFLYRTIDRMYEVYRCKSNGKKPKALTAVNKKLYDTYHVPGATDVWFEGAEGAKVHGFLVEPKDYVPGKKYPMMVRVHGGPQQMFGYAFRYEFTVFSSAGYFVLFMNPRGSTGYGQAFTDGVRADWGGKPIDDLKAGVAHVLENNPDIDKDRVGAWGGSYGGYVCNWLQGHNEDKMFAALVSHAGGADRWVDWGTTEELWFPEWEMKGPPWENPDLIEKWSPIRYAKNFNTPHLLTHGDLDYRVRVTGGETMFSALQRRGVPSKMIRFPDENHWIMQPHNQRFWYQSILDWFEQWLKPGAGKSNPQA